MNDKTAKAFRRLADDVREGLLPKLRDSAVVMSIGPDIGSADTKSAVEIGFALLLDKPLVVLADRSRNISKRLLRAADHVVYCDLNDETDRERAIEEVRAIMKPHATG